MTGPINQSKDFKQSNETNLVNIAVKVDEASTNVVADNIIKILKASDEVRANDEIILAALQTLKASATISNLTFDGFSVVNDNSRTTNVEVTGEGEVEGQGIVTSSQNYTGVKVSNPYD